MVGNVYALIKETSSTFVAIIKSNLLVVFLKCAIFSFHLFLSTLLFPTYRIFGIMEDHLYKRGG